MLSERHSEPYHPMTQGKIKRYYRTMKNVIRLEHYYLQREIEQFIKHYNR